VRSTTFLFTTLCTSIQLFGEKRSQSRVDRLKNGSAALQSGVGAPGALPVRSAPRAVLRESRLPRRPCGSFPTASRSGSWSPSRLPSLERESISVPRRTASCVPPGGPSPTHAARAYRGWRRAGALRRRPAAAPAYKGSAPAVLHRPQHAPTHCPCVRSRGRPPLARVAQSSASLAAPHSPYDLPSTTAPPPRPEHRRTEALRG
jgi:hypothetical protein